MLDVSFPIISGYSSRSKYVISNQIQMGLNPIVLTSPHQATGKEIEYHDGLKYHRSSLPHSNLLTSIPGFNEILFVNAMYKRILQVAQTEQVVIIHAHSPSLLGLAAIKAAKRMDVKVVYEIRAFWEDAAVASRKHSQKSPRYRLSRKLETYVCSHVHRVVTISKAMKNELISRGISEDKIFVVPNGVDQRAFEPRLKNVDLLRRIGLEGKTVFGYIGTFYCFEGIDDLVDAFASFHNEEKNVALVLVGGGETENRIKHQLDKLNIDDIVFVGKVPHEKVVEYYSLMDIMVYPRKSMRITELTTPLKPLEAMALGKPVVCSSVGGLIELVGADNGLFFPPGNRKILVECLKKLLHDIALREKIARNGKKRALLEKRWDIIVKSYTDIYNSI